MAPAAHAGDGALDILSAESLTAYGDARVVAANGEKAWTDGGFGKLRYGGDGTGGGDGFDAKPELGEAGLVWQPRLGWAFSGTVVALAQEGEGRSLEAGLSEAYLTYKPLGGGPIRISARAGLMWPPISMEHAGPEWAVADTVTPSAIGSWIGEEVKVVGLEVTAKGQAGAHEIAATVAVFDDNDTAGALLTFRGWALHDRKALAFRRQPLPPLDDFAQSIQPRYTHPLLDLDSGFFKRPGLFGKIAWTAPVPVRLEATHYDNGGDPLAVNADLEWGWRTRFDTLGLAADLGAGREIRAQGLSGRTRMGDKLAGRNWIDMRFRAAFGQVTQRFARGSVSARVDLFDTRNRGSGVQGQDDEHGWAATVAARRELSPALTALIEYLHVESDRQARTRTALEPQQSQDQVQMVMRARW